MFSSLNEKLQTTIYILVVLILIKMFFLNPLLEFISAHSYVFAWLIACIGWGIYTNYRLTNKTKTPLDDPPPGDHF